jgi:single-strand DNA-binding protein
VDLKSNAQGKAHPPSATQVEHVMSFVRIEQRNARLAAAVKLDQIKGREGLITKGTVVVISNVRKGESREDEVTSILWTLWGKQAENAAEYLGKGSRVNVVGRLENNNYEDKDGEKVYGFTFTCEEIDYLDSKAESEARRLREHGASEPGPSPSKGKGRRAAHV